MVRLALLRLYSLYWPLCVIGVLYTALALKGIDYEYKAVHLVQDGGQQVTCVLANSQCLGMLYHSLCAVLRFIQESQSSVCGTNPGGRWSGPDRVSEYTHTRTHTHTASLSGPTLN